MDQYPVLPFREGDGTFGFHEGVLRIGGGVGSGDYMLCLLDGSIDIPALDVFGAEDITSFMKVRSIILQGFLHGQNRRQYLIGNCYKGS